MHACPALRPRRNLRAKTCQARRCCLPCHPRRRLPGRVFRGSITRPAGSLSTLRSAGHPDTAQDSLPAGGHLCRAGLITRWVPNEVSRYVRSSLPPHPGLTWRKDGNCIEATEHRLEVLRRTPAGPLPGKSLVVYDASLAMAIDVFPCEDGHAQERSLLAEVLATVEADDLWIWDRNFCVRGFLEGIAGRKGHFIGRHHKGLVYSALGPERFVGTIETGAVYEQSVEVAGTDGRPATKYRLIRVRLKKATRDGDMELRILTSLPKSVANAQQVAELYRRRWDIETTFQKLEKYLNSEVNSLGYPKAALLAFCVALVAYNVLAVVAAALRRVHGDDVIAQKVSGFYIAGELARGHEGVGIAIRPKEWSRLRKLSDAAYRDLLLEIAATVDLSKYKKHVRGPKKPPPARTQYLNTPHVSTARLLRDKK